ncbi:hypothetical protein OG474_19185 [Kribbella sp. NBC_01505]|uniref:hypothetical protein n=1 Tax=Kribbella sp. NBC_01505 TaxID=2903580 RepID=UPI00386B1893
MTRWLVAAGCLTLVLTGCTAANRTATPTPKPAVFTTVPRVSETPKPPAKFHFTAEKLEAALPTAFGTFPLKKSRDVYPGADPKPRPDPLVLWSVSPEICRNVIRYRGVPGSPGDFVDPTTPSAGAVAEIGPLAVNERPFVSAVVVELAPALGDRLLDQRIPTPPECAHVLLNGADRAAMVERVLPGYGVRSRYIVRTFPLGDQTYTERTLTYRTDQYVVVIRQDSFDNPEATFLAFAAKTRDGLAKLKPNV